MAKGSAMGLWKGKKGSSVFYKIKNSNSAQKQGVRERVYEVSNPKSVKQAQQRMKMLPAQYLATQLKSVIDRGFQGVAYGAKSRQEFLKYALKMTEGIPAIEKGSNKIWPGTYLISKGQLAAVNSEIKDGGDYVSTSLSYFWDDESGVAPTIGSLSSYLIAHNAGLNAGDQLTFVVCAAADTAFENMIPTWLVRSIIIDPSNTDFLNDYEPQIELSADENSNLGFAAYNNDLPKVMAAAVIVSREGNSGAHLRSDATLVVNSEYSDQLFSATAFSRALRTYMGNGSATTDWPVDPEEVTINGDFTISDLTGTKASANGKKCLVKYDLQTGYLVGVYYVLAEDDPDTKLICNSQGRKVYYIADAQEGTELPLSVSDIPDFEGMPAYPFVAGA